MNMNRGISTMIRLTVVMLSAMLPGFAQAADTVQLTSQVFVERIVADASGRKTVMLDQPSLVTPGDKLVFVLRYRNAGPKPSDNFVVTNPMPSAVAFQDAPGSTPSVSVDGGKNWGLLAELTIAGQDGRLRPARADDVTHVRWKLAEPLGVGAGGKLTFRGIVR
jgi:uncharacterized repeat protein (TIGR01451 family)